MDEIDTAIEDRVNGDMSEVLALLPTSITDSVVSFLQLGGLTALSMHQQTPLTPNKLEEEGFLNTKDGDNIMNSHEVKK